MIRTLRAVRFLFTGPFILLLVYVISRLTPAGGEWFKWAALGIGIAWLVALIRVLQALILVGGLAALVMWLRKRDSGNGPASPLS